MSAITAWLTGILSVVILGTVVDLLLSESKMGKYVRSVFAAVTVLVIILPIPGFFQNGCSFENDFIIENKFTLDENYLAYANRVKLDSLARGVEEQLRQDGIKNAAVCVEGEITASEVKIQLVRVNLKNAVIDEKMQHINKYELVSGKIAEYLGIEKGQVIVEG
ncbi:MAG: stage III sporulation protein AF [Firmicutes bacterium]|nr:stage III sporulation protein AF [Bacillota bacterium]